MKLKKLVLCLALLLPMCSCTDNNQKENKVTFEFDVSFYGSKTNPFDNKYMMSCPINSVRLNGDILDFSQYNISMDTLVAGEKICFEMDENADYRSTTALWVNSLYLYGKVYDVHIKPASVVELRIKKIDNEVHLVDLNSTEVMYTLLDDEYSNVGHEEKINPVFHSLLGGTNYTLLENLDEETKVYGTYIQEQFKDNKCTLYALYSFNPYSK